ncbi:hypothetical protein ACTHT3_20390, partial [Neisseria sp. P0015.S004]
MKLLFCLCQGRFLHQPPSVGCVLILLLFLLVQYMHLPAAFGVLFDETTSEILSFNFYLSSRLRAAVC